MAKMKVSTPIDLFGNPAQTPRGIMQEQLANLVDSIAKQSAGMGPRGQSAQVIGGALGGLTRMALINTGVLPKPPEVELAEKREEVRKGFQDDIKEKGIDPATDPEGFADKAIQHFMAAGLEADAMKAVMWKQQQIALRQAAAKDKAEVENKEADTGLKKANKTKAETETGLMERDMRVKERRVELLSKLTDAKMKTSLPSSSQEAARVVRGYLERVDAWEKGGKSGTEPAIKPSERKALDELQRVGVLDQLMRGAVGGPGAPAPAATGNVDFDFTSQ